MRFFSGQDPAPLNRMCSTSHVQSVVDEARPAHASGLGAASCLAGRGPEGDAEAAPVVVDPEFVEDDNVDSLDDIHPVPEEGQGLRQGYGYWSSVINGWLKPGPRSEWARRVTQSRILNQDRARPFITRGMLLTALACCLWILEAHPLALASLLLGAVQTGLELAFEPTVRAKAEEVAHESPLAKFWLGRALVHQWYRNDEESITNYTGLLGLAAAPVNLLAVLYGLQAAAEPAWLRVLALCFAMCFLVSGVLGPLADKAMYSPKTRIPSALAITLRWAWVPVIAVISALILAAPQAHAWGETSPYALIAVAGIGYYPMLRCREYERTMTAAQDTADDLAAQQYVHLALGLHNLLQPVKRSLVTATQVITDRGNRAELIRYLRDMEHLYRQARNRTIDLSQELGLPVEEHLRSMGVEGMVRVHARVDLPRDMDPLHARRARQWLMVMVHNSLQACRSWNGEGRPVVDVSAHLEGDHVLLAVSDQLDLIPQERWQDATSTLHLIGQDVMALGGVMTQARTSTGKTITMRWPVMQYLVAKAPQERIR